MEDVFEEDPELFWRMRTGVKRLRANPQGLRGPLPPISKEDHDLRIACLGDSCTFGAGVRLEDTYGWQLQMRLQERLPQRRVQLILAALPGYSTYQSKVLFQKHVAPRKPDITILYCGTWNDYIPAIQLSDADRAKEALASRSNVIFNSRMFKFFKHAIQRIASKRPDPQAYRDGFKKGQVPDGRRVPLSNFEANIKNLVNQAKGCGSLPIIIVPPLPQFTEQKFPVSLVYRKALRRIAIHLEVPLLNGPEIFKPHVYPYPKDLPKKLRGFWPCFNDNVHPSIMGHRLLAEGLTDLLAEEMIAEKEPHAGKSIPNTGLKVQSISPSSVVAGTGEKVIIRGIGFQNPHAYARVLAGPWWIPDVEVLSDERLSLTIPRTIPPGEYRIRLNCSTGPLSLSQPLTVKPARLQAEICKHKNQRQIMITIHGSPGWDCGAWISHKLRANPANTQFGPFYLASIIDGRPQGWEAAPFCFRRLKLPWVIGKIERNGVWSVKSASLLRQVSRSSGKLYVQGILSLRPSHAVLTEVVALDIQK